MKRFGCIALLLALLLAFSACGGGAKDGMETTAGTTGGAVDSSESYQEENEESLSESGGDDTVYTPEDDAYTEAIDTENPSYVSPEGTTLPEWPDETYAETEAEDSGYDNTYAMYVVYVDAIVLRKGPGEEFEAVGTAKRGDTVLFVESYGGWSLVLVDGEPCYAESDFLSSDPEVDA